MIDSHVHIDFDNIEEELNNYIKKAKEIGIQTFTVTDHVIISNAHTPNFKVKENKVYLKDMAFLKCSLISPQIQKYIDAIQEKAKEFDIRIGAEVDHIEKYEKATKEFLESYPFDLVLGSLHFVNDYSIGRKQEMSNFTQNIPTVEIYKQYFGRLTSMIESKLFDVVSHIDLIRKHTDYVEFRAYKEDAERTIDLLLENDVGLEVNTSGHAFIVDSYPTMEFLDLCNKKGLKKITIGSDAHRVENLGDDLERALAKLKIVGYDKICSFRNRKPEYTEI